MSEALRARVAHVLGWLRAEHAVYAEIEAAFARALPGGRTRDTCRSRPREPERGVLSPELGCEAPADALGAGDAELSRERLGQPELVAGLPRPAVDHLRPHLPVAEAHDQVDAAR